MAFSQEQISHLSAPLDRANVKKRKQGKVKNDQGQWEDNYVSYIEGYHAENEANRIFGFGEWDRFTDFKCVSERERTIGDGQSAKPGWGVTYTAKVRIEVTMPDGKRVIREGTGAGHGIDVDLGQAHESALKEAETDAEKRALKTFGNPFGQALYDKTQSDVVKGPSASLKKALEVVATKTAVADLGTWWNAQKAGLKNLMPADEYQTLIKAVTDRKAVIEAGNTDFNEAA